MTPVESTIPGGGDADATATPEPGAAPETILREDKTRWCSTWSEAGEVVRRIAGELPLYWGTGNPIHFPHVVAATLDAWSGQGTGYRVHTYPRGDVYGLPCRIDHVRVGTPPSGEAPVPPPAPQP